MIEVERLSQHYGGFRALDDVTFTALPGRVTGFLGPNGAGKSTAMRAMVGLLRPTSGRIRIDGRPFVDIPDPGHHVGVLLDASAQHAGRTGREILTIAQQTMGLPSKRVEEMLDLVGLTRAESKRRVRHYSLGMRQRLGIATALIGHPSVLILDEPANGLDPAGIRWMRDLLRGFADDGGTVLLSSHLLHEIEVVADDLVLIGRGRIVAQGTTASLLATGGVVVSSGDDLALERLLTETGHVVRRSGAGLHVEAEAAEIGRLALEARIPLTGLRADQGGLEEMFLQLTAADARDTTSEGTAA